MTEPARQGAPDLLLSSGFLAFARHIGVLRALEEAGQPVNAIVGTSSGALVGALRAAGLPSTAIERAVLARPPWRYLGPHAALWRGLFTMDPLRVWLADQLPPRFEDLPCPFAVGVTGPGGRHRLVSSGPLPDAVAASCALPWFFVPIRLGGEALSDGGASDRLAIDAWRRWRPARRAIVHLVERTAGREAPADLAGCVLVETPRSGASFLSLGDVPAQIAAARALAAAALGRQTSIDILAATS